VGEKKRYFTLRTCLNFVQTVIDSIGSGKIKVTSKVTPTGNHTQIFPVIHTYFQQGLTCTVRSATSQNSTVPNNVLRLVWLFQELGFFITERDVHRTFTAIRDQTELARIVTH
jgi:hypothetical protein